MQFRHIKPPPRDWATTTGREDLPDHKWPHPPVTPELSPPPRRAPWLARWTVALGNTGCLWLFLLPFAAAGFGSLLQSEAVTPLLFLGSTSLVEGDVVAVDRSHVSENETEVWEVAFAYPVDGTMRRATSYRAGQPELRVGDGVPVEYVASRPERARIVGFRYRRLGLVGMIVGLMFAAAGFGIPLAVLIQGIRSARLLNVGRLALARPVARVAKKDSDHDWALELHYAYDAPSQHHTGMYRDAAHTTDRRTITQHVSHAEYDAPAAVWVLFDPAPAGHAELVSELHPIRLEGSPRGGSWGVVVPVAIYALVILVTVVACWP